MLDGLTLDQLRTLVAIAEARSFRAAAGRLSRVQSAVSQAIANLEAELGIRLFDRSGYRPTLTPAGQALIGDARAILLKVDSMRARARGLGEGLELSLAIALDPQFPLDLAVAALKELHDSCPSVSVRMWTAPLGASIVALRAGRCDLAITAAEMADHLQIVVPDPSQLTDGRDFGVLSPGTWQASDNEIKRALILAGVGWGSLPLWLVERDLAEGRLVRIAAAEFGQRGETFVRAYLAHRMDHPLGPAARAFRQALLRLADGSTIPTARERGSTGN